MIGFHVAQKSWQVKESQSLLLLAIVYIPQLKIETHSMEPIPAQAISHPGIG